MFVVRAIILTLTQPGCVDVPWSADFTGQCLCKQIGCVSRVTSVRTLVTINRTTIRGASDLTIRDRRTTWHYNAKLRNQLTIFLSVYVSPYIWAVLVFKFRIYYYELYNKKKQSVSIVNTWFISFVILIINRDWTQWYRFLYFQSVLVPVMTYTMLLNSRNTQLGSWITGPPTLEVDSKWWSWTLAVTRRRSVVFSGMSELSSTTKTGCHDMTLDVGSVIKAHFIHPSIHQEHYDK